MGNTIRMLMGSTKPINYVLKAYDDEMEALLPIDLDDCTVTITIHKDGDEDPIVDSGECTIDSETTGKVYFDPADVEFTAGMYHIKYLVDDGTSIGEYPMDYPLWLHVMDFTSE